MAQPSGRICGASTRYRLYLCSSPLFCFADGLAILLRMLATSIYLQISLLKASRLVIISRSDERHHSKRNKNTCFDDPSPDMIHESPPPGNTANWPRWFFFLGGTVPATIQLVSFSGVPGTQILGFMFVSSFAIIELVNFLSMSKEHKTTPEVLDYKKTGESPAKEQKLRSKAYKLTICLEWCESALFTMTFIAHFAIMTELVHQIWLPELIPVYKLYNFSWMQWIYIPFSLFPPIIAIMILLLTWNIWPALGRWLHWGKWPWFWIFNFYCICNIITSSKRYSHSDQSISRKRADTLVWVGPFFAISTSGMERICERCPSIAKAFLIHWKPWDLEKIKHLPPTDRTGFENETGVVHGRACICFFIFLSDLVVCLLWYTLVYNSKGTVNPNWTFVFG